LTDILRKFVSTHVWKASFQNLPIPWNAVYRFLIVDYEPAHYLCSVEADFVQLSVGNISVFVASWAERFQHGDGPFILVEGEYQMRAWAVRIALLKM
jgi:hypothetical protein